MVRELKVLLVILLCLPLVGAWPNTGKKYPPAGAAGYTGPGDVVSGATFFISCQFAYSAAEATAATQATCNLQRASDSVTCDVIIKATGSWGNTSNCSNGGASNGITAASFCNATTCSVPEAYDQTGNGYHMQNFTAADQPTITFSGVGVGSNAVMTFSGSSQGFNTGPQQVPGNAQPYTFTLVGDSTSASIGIFVSSLGTSNAPRIYNSSATQWATGAGSDVSATANDNTWHAASSVLNSTSSAFDIDGTTTTGNGGTEHWNNGTGVQAGLGENIGGTFLTGYIGESGFWFSGFTSGQQTSMNSNMHSRWGF